MSFFLSERNTRAVEKMDNPECNLDLLHKTYRRFSVINAVISGWKQIYKTRIKPEIVKTGGFFSLLDIGFGGGDIPIKLAKWAAADGFDLQITAIDTDKRAVKYVQQLATPKNVTFLQCSSSELIKKSERYDMVISNHLLHHLTTVELVKLLEQAKQLSTKEVFFSDIERNGLAYELFNVFSRPFSVGSFITKDGLTSIKRSYTKQELQDVVPEGWQVERMRPFRLLLSYDHG